MLARYMHVQLCNPPYLHVCYLTDAYAHADESFFISSLSLSLSLSIFPHTSLFMGMDLMLVSCPLVVY